MQGVKWSLAAVLAVVAFGGSAAEIKFLATEDNDLANAKNWSASAWTSADTLVVATNSFTMPADGLRVSSDMPASAELKFGAMPAENVTVDFGGHSLNTTTLRIGNMHDDIYRNYYIKAIGGFTGVTNFMDDKMKGHIRFFDGVYRIKNKIFINNWYPYVYVCSGAEVIVENVIADCGIWMHSDASLGKFILDGGKFSVLHHDTSNFNWMRVIWDSSYKSVGDIQFLNGSVYDDSATLPSTCFRWAKLLIKDSAYYATNATSNARNTEFTMSSKKEITNSVFRTAQILCGKSLTLGKDALGESLKNATVDFCDSEVTLAYPPNASATLAARAGFGMDNGIGSTVRIRGEKNRFTTQQFALGGVSNKVEIGGGAFDVSNKFTVAASLRTQVSISNTTAYIKQLGVSAAATNAALTLAKGAKVTGGGDFSVGGVNGSMSVREGAVLTLDQHCLKIGGTGFSFVAEGSVVTAGVNFAGSNGRVVLSEGTMLRVPFGAGWNHITPIAFAEGQANNVLVISNATYDACSYVAKEYIKTGEGPTQEGVPFTNCPNCRIEFQGETPKFVVPSAKGSESAGSPWYALVLGEMIDYEKNCWSTRHYLLKDPVRVRYVLPPNGYGEAPLQCLENAIVLGGNAEFEFDASRLVWPNQRVEIPLVYCANGYTGWNNRSYVNVTQLNETNAERLPTSPSGKKAFLKMSADGKTLNLVVRGGGGMVLLVM